MTSPLLVTMVLLFKNSKIIWVPVFIWKISEFRNIFLTWRLPVSLHEFSYVNANMRWISLLKLDFWDLNELAFQSSKTIAFHCVLPFDNPLQYWQLSGDLSICQLCDPIFPIQCIFWLNSCKLLVLNIGKRICVQFIIWKVTRVKV